MHLTNDFNDISTMSYILIFNPKIRSNRPKRLTTRQSFCPNERAVESDQRDNNVVLVLEA